jgi:HAMP domain-containing protein
LTLAAGGAVFVALAIASLVIYFDVRSKLHDQIDISLIHSAEGIAAKWVTANANGPLKLPSAKTGSTGKRPAGTSRGPRNPKSANAALPFGKDTSGFFQVIPSVGAVTNGGLSGFVPLVGRDESVASGLSPPYFRDVRFAGAAMRLYTMRLPSSSGGLVRTARPLTEANATIARVRWLLFGLTLGGALAAGLLGRLAANAVLRPVRALAGAVREVSATRDLNQRIPVSGRDELASLAADFNAMLAALDESQQAQQQRPLREHTGTLAQPSDVRTPSAERAEPLGARAPCVAVGPVIRCSACGARRAVRRTPPGSGSAGAAARRSRRRRPRVSCARSCRSSSAT